MTAVVDVVTTFATAAPCSHVSSCPMVWSQPSMTSGGLIVITRWVAPRGP